MPDFGNGQAVLTDAYLDVRLSETFRVRVGKDKTPVGHEVLQRDAYLSLPERALASSLIPNRDVGIQVLGELVGGRPSYTAGVFNGVPDGVSSQADTDTDGSKDLAGRITLRAFLRGAQVPAGVLDGLGLHIGASRGEQAGALPSFRTSSGLTYFSYEPGAAASGTRVRVSPAVSYYYQSLGTFAEYVRSTQTITRVPQTRDIANHAWQVTGTHVVTGEAASDRGVRPDHDFDPQAGHWGAVQVLARYAVLTVDADAFEAGLAASGASREAQSWGGHELVSEPGHEVVCSVRANRLRAGRGTAAPTRGRDHRARAGRVLSTSR